MGAIVLAVLWNTIYMDAALDQLRAEGVQFADLPPEAVDSLVDEAVATTRQARGGPLTVGLIVDTNVLISALLTATVSRRS